MTLSEMKKKTLALIEELNPDIKDLTEDPDIAAKLNYVTNQIMFEVARIKKIPKYVEISVSAGDLITLEDISRECGYDVYQRDKTSGARHLERASGTVIKALEDGVLEIDCFVYPERITEKTKDSYEFELFDDALEVMPYGIAAHLLKSDESAEYGTVYESTYRTMLQQLDPRYALTGVSIEGGVYI